MSPRCGFSIFTLKNLDNIHILVKDQIIIVHDFKIIITLSKFYIAHLKLIRQCEEEFEKYCNKKFFTFVQNYLVIAHAQTTNYMHFIFINHSLP